MHEAKKVEGKVHLPVLLTEVIKGLGLTNAPLKERRPQIIDATLGLGGHATEIINHGGSVLGIEADTESLKLAEERIRIACPSPDDPVGRKYVLVHGNFIQIASIARNYGFTDVDAILFDLGISSYQLGDVRKGLSFQNPTSPLDMRLDQVTQKITAAILLNVLSFDQLVKLFQIVMEPGPARKLVEKVIAVRQVNKFETVGDLLSVVEGLRYKKGIHPATLPFLALRIAVNSELDNLKDCLPGAFSLLRKGGRLLVISFHSGEDVIVKSFFEEEQKIGEAEILTNKPIKPSADEVKNNPRARSAKLRILEKII